MKKGLVFVLAVMLMLNLVLQAVPTFAGGQPKIGAVNYETVDLNSFSEFLNEDREAYSFSSVPIMKSGAGDTDETEASSDSSTYSVSSLTDEELASILYAAAKALVTRVNLAGYNVTLDQLKRGMELIFWYKPDLFYLNATYGYTYYEGTNVAALAILNYRMSNDEIKAARVVFENGLNEIVAQVDSSWSQMEKVLFVHNWIVVNCEYDRSYTYADAYSVLTLRKGVCQGYSLLFGAIMAKLGIGVNYVVSVEKTHMWNVVCVDGKWYHLDLTWDDPVCFSGASNPGVDRLGRVSYDYFLVTDEQIKDNDHPSWSCSVEVSTEEFTDRFFSDTKSDCVYVDGKWYFVDESTRMLNCYDSAKDITTDLGLSTGKWYVWGSSSRYYSASYSGVASYDGKVYYSTRNGIKCYDPAEGKAVTVVTADTSNGYVYGMRSKGNGVLEYAISTSYEVKASAILTSYVGGLDLVEGSSCGLSDYVTGVEDGTTVAGLTAQFRQAVTVYNSHGDKLLGDEILKTGDRVCVVIDGVTYRDVSVAVKGDVDGKRGADTIDYIKIKLQVKFENLLTGVFRTAADFDGNGVVDSTDGLCAKLRLKQA